MRRTKIEVKAELTRRLDAHNRKRALFRKYSAVCITLVIMAAITLASAQAITGYMNNSRGSFNAAGVKDDDFAYAGSPNLEGNSADAPSNDFLLGDGTDKGSYNGTTSEMRDVVITEIILLGRSNTVEVTSASDIDAILSSMKKFTLTSEKDDIAVDHRVEIMVFDSEANRYYYIYGNGSIRTDSGICASEDEGKALEALLRNLGLEF